MESPEVLAIGACSPATADGAGGDRPGGPARLVRAWRIAAGRATPVSLSVRRDELTPGVATLYSLDGARPGRLPAWLAGPPASSWSRWRRSSVPAVRHTADSRAAVDERAAPAGWFVGLVVRGPG